MREKIDDKEIDVKMFKMSQVAAITGVKRSRLQVWLENGWIIPAKKADGHGTRNIFSTENLYQIETFKRLIEGGISRAIAGKAVESIEFCNFAVLLVRHGRKVWLSIIDNVIFFASYHEINFFPKRFESNRQILLFNLSQIVNDIDVRKRRSDE